MEHSFKTVQTLSLICKTFLLYSASQIFCHLVLGPFCSCDRMKASSSSSISRLPEIKSTSAGAISSVLYQSLYPPQSRAKTGRATYEVTNVSLVNGMNVSKPAEILRSVYQTYGEVKWRTLEYNDNGCGNQSEPRSERLERSFIGETISRNSLRFQSFHEATKS